ncbi:MAG: GNAT family N-acetyltransferase [Acidimicrobiales bacterium]
MSDLPVAPGVRIERARFHELANEDLYDILQLRSQVFVLEQDCVYLDLDGRDREPATEHLWVRDARGVATTLRLLDEGDGVWSIGRVVTRPDVRSTGIASRMVDGAIAILEEQWCTEIRIGAQAHLEQWYAGFGFAQSGPAYVEDGIPHVPMRRDSSAGSSP